MLHICRVNAIQNFSRLDATNLDSGCSQQPADRLHFPSSIEVMHHNFRRHFLQLKRHFKNAKDSLQLVFMVFCGEDVTQLVGGAEVQIQTNGH